MKVVALYSIKGGVGKTAAAVNLSYLCALSGARTLLWDLDPQAAASFYYRIPPTVDGGAKRLLRRKEDVDAAVRASDYENLDVLPADFSYRNLDLELDRQKRRKHGLRRVLDTFESKYDYIFLDCAPSISLISENVFRASGAILSPVIPTHLSIRTRAQLVQFIDRPKLKGLRLWHFFSMVDRRRKLHREVMESLGGQERARDILRSYIPYSSVVETMGERRAPIETYAASSAAAHAFRLLWREVQINLEPGSRIRDAG